MAPKHIYRRLLLVGYRLEYQRMDFVSAKSEMQTPTCNSSQKKKNDSGAKKLRILDEKFKCGERNHKFVAETEHDHCIILITGARKKYKRNNNKCDVCERVIWSRLKNVGKMPSNYINVYLEYILFKVNICR